jgi:hypothetical protein
MYSKDITIELINGPLSSRKSKTKSTVPIHPLIHKALSTGVVQDYHPSMNGNDILLLPDVSTAFSCACIFPLRNMRSTVSSSSTVYNHNSDIASIDVMIVGRSTPIEPYVFNQYMHIEKDGLMLLCHILNNILEHYYLYQYYNNIYKKQNDMINLLSHISDKSNYVGFTVSSQGHIINYTNKFIELFNKESNINMIKENHFSSVIELSRKTATKDSNIISPRLINNITTSKENSTNIGTISNGNMELVNDINNAIKHNQNISKSGISLALYHNSNIQLFQCDYDITFITNNTNTTNNKSNSSTSSSIYQIIIAIKDNNTNTNSTNGLIACCGSNDSSDEFKLTLPSINIGTNSPKNNTNKLPVLSSRMNSISPIEMNNNDNRNNNLLPFNLISSHVSEHHGKNELQNVNQWEFNALKLTTKEQLYNAILICFENFIDFNDIGIDKIKLMTYIVDVDSFYKNNPFHNFYHAVSVTHFTHMLLKYTVAKSVLSDINIFAIILSGMVHDVDHPGNTNLYEINKGTELALRYNDVSVLENHHCATAFHIMNSSRIRLLETLPLATRNEIRKTVVGCVLATDMALHVNIVREMSERTVDDHQWLIDSPIEKLLYGKIIVHAADLSNPVRPFAMAKDWAMRVSEEFNKQIELEKAEGLPVSSFLATPDTKQLAKNEIYFSSQVVVPMWRSMAKLFPSIQHLVHRADSNIDSWKSLLDKLE